MSASEVAKQLGQVLVAVVTPMTPDGEVDWGGVESLIDNIVSQGADGIVVSGTTGESATLTDAEKLQLVRTAKQVAGNRAAVISGAPSNETAHAMLMAKKSAEAGADGILLVTPYYAKPTQSGVLTHIRMVADVTDLPVILYDIPGRSGIELTHDTIVRAAKHPNVVAVKDAKGNFSEVSRVLNETDLAYYSGDDAHAIAHAALGAVGVVSVTGNIAAAAYRKMFDAINANDFASALKMHQALEPLVRATMTHIPGAVSSKYILHGLGRIHSPRVRLPYVGPEDVEAAQIEQDIDAITAEIPGVSFADFRPDRNAAAGGALPKVPGATRE